MRKEKKHCAAKIRTLSHSEKASSIAFAMATAKSNRFCKFYARGTCLKGELCCFSHERNEASSDICLFYQKGYCAYGSQCRNRHVKPSQASASASTSANGPVSLVSQSAMTHSAAKGKFTWVRKADTKVLSPTDKHTSSLQHKNQHSQGTHCEVGESSAAAMLDENLFCEFDAANCTSGDKCTKIHGILCLYCRKPCLHPTNLEQRSNHTKICKEKAEIMKNSQDIECSVCLERVLRKPRPSQRKFGLLPECDHPFCLDCIIRWRSMAPTNAMDCPVCRKHSSFYVQSDIWYATKEEKQAIIDNYKANCKLIDCKYFKFGTRQCPHGSSCMYKHAVKPVLRKQRQNRPQPQIGGDNLNKYDIMSQLSEFDLHPHEFYSILKDMEWFDDMSAIEKMALADELAGPTYGDSHFFPQDDFFDSDDDFDDEEFDPIDAAISSMMMSGMPVFGFSDDEYSDNEARDGKDSDGESIDDD
ncbi:E3 ubiquitin-protein ligase makorin-like isoform X3 [Arachis stenosperma]|uniref:E3 ubiquitin-protein ligase makorin-like isoform X3 n=1 Tax=Arachis stenosperma TaxID=217475 RepID=UPI0025AD62C0|nr:E3 ubiquitin-protein ligase makorin-like isoform X3 [Arachis stenosperma]